MVFSAINIDTFEAIYSTTIMNLAKNLNISSRQLSKFVNQTKKFQKSWVISSGDVIKCKRKGNIKAIVQQW